LRLACGEGARQGWRRSHVSGYLGSNDAFDEPQRRFARAYADQTEQHHATLVKAVKSGRIRAQTMSALPSGNMSA
jgi:lysophospholipase L1-like esterase